jgi:hypothetical protein
VPDVLCCYEHHFVALEIKRPGGRLTPIQAAVIDQIRAAGGIAEIVTSVEDTALILAEMSK